ncbi:MAG: stage II sporulation protein P [Ruminococcus sp.]|uniref:stage II sporulation protein P n=1 Tax=Ruminococcus sp. TaxID=41978 RepID=UPI001B22489D|nr:stage II sporulation protein P [Ruminococcus sp.]MBO7472839.1 stage II sporulation protein P [Ruminococcus sp.]
MISEYTYPEERGEYMTRHKRRKIKGTVRCIAALLVPVTLASSFKGYTALRNALTGEYSYTIESTGKASAYRREDVEEIISRIKREDELLSGADILSEGYGYADESDEEREYLRLPNPLDMRADAPGEKPYPSEWGSGGEIMRMTYGKYSGNSFFDLENGGQVNNRTDIPNEELQKESGYYPNFTVEKTDEPLVLLYHTHTTESFEPFVRESFDPSFNYRTTDDTKNVVMVGNAIQAELEAQGIGVIHAVDIHDYPSYNGSYSRSRETILPILEKYPSIKVVLDIHRDAIASENCAYQPFIEEDGREAAQIMIISGCDDGTLGMPNYMQNYHFACTLQSKLENDHEGFTRPVLFDYRHYNQDLTNGSLLIEVGSHGNTLEQAQYAGQLFGRSLGELLNSMKR